MSSGKRKGSSYEREICKFLTEWLTGSKKPYVWWRSPSSGAVASISEENKELSGDIITVRPEGAFLTDIFSLEIKTGYPHSSFHKHLKNVKNEEIKGFWDQCTGDALRANKIPMLIFKKKGFNTIIGIQDTTIKILDSIRMKEFKEKIPILDTINNIGLKWAKIPQSVIFFDLVEFFVLITPAILIKMKEIVCQK